MSSTADYYQWSDESGWKPNYSDEPNAGYRNSFTILRKGASQRNSENLIVVKKDGAKVYLICYLVTLVTDKSYEEQVADLRSLMTVPSKEQVEVLLQNAEDDEVYVQCHFDDTADEQQNRFSYLDAYHTISDYITKIRQE